MPKAAPLEDALAKKGGLTLSQLVDYDDRLTDALVDRVYYWSTIRKLRPGFHAARGVREEDVCRILQNEVVLNKDPVAATRQLLELPALKRYSDSLKTKDEKEHFQRHLAKYVRIYMPDCAFEVCTTNRYTITTHEASVVARKVINKNEAIRHLTGIQVAMTKQEERDLDIKNRDFSIVMSSRKKVPSLFLGPARFANHDCNANARLSTTGAHGMQVVSVRNIDIGEEITVKYGDDYFGEDNCECLCATCERLRRNGWAKKRKHRGETDEGRETSKEVTVTEERSLSPARQEEQEPVSTPDSYSLRRKRKFMFDIATHSPIPTDSIPSSPAPSAKRQRLSIKCEEPTPEPKSVPPKKQSSPLATTSGPLAELKIRTQKKKPLTYSRLSRQGHFLSESSADRSTSPASSLLGNSQAPSASTEATSIDDLEPTETMIKSDSDLSELSSACSLDDKNQRIVRRRRRGMAPTRQSLRNRALPTTESFTPSLSRSASPVSSSDSDSDSGSDADKLPRHLRRRRPGDHTLTRLLLPTAYCRWVECRNCDQVFVQDDAYQTRANCPRCERHSKLYGYAWPKTDRAGKGDAEERVLDHREVNRFVARIEEMKERKGRLGGVLREKRSVGGLA